MDKYMQDKVYTNFLLDINELIEKLNILFENGSLAIQEWKKVKKQEYPIQEYQFAKERVFKNCSVTEEIYSNLAFTLINKIRQAEEFLCDEELDNLKRVVWHDIQQMLLSWDHYQSQKENSQI